MGIEIRGMAPLLSVFDMSTSLAFYRKLGFSVVQDSGQGDNSGWVMLEQNGFQLMLNTQYEDASRPSERDRANVEAHHDTVIYFGCPQVDAAYEYLSKMGIKSDAPNVAQYGMKQLYLLDPDGYNLCYQWPEEPEASS
jgi:glyoxylase I family protein